MNCADKRGIKSLLHGFGRCSGEGLAFVSSTVHVVCSAVKALDSCIATGRRSKYGEGCNGIVNLRLHFSNAHDKFFAVCRGSTESGCSLNETSKDYSAGLYNTCARIKDGNEETRTVTCGEGLDILGKQKCLQVK